MSYFDILAAKAGAGGGTPTPLPVLIEKSVTQNGTYTASADEADGYSAVTVNVPSTANFNKVISYAWINPNDSNMGGIIILRSQDGIYDLRDFKSLGNRDVVIIAVDPLAKMLYTNYVGNGRTIVSFTPAEDYDGFYMNGSTKYNPSGSAVTNGDGKSYGFRTTSYSSSSAIQAFNTDWSFDMS